MDESKTVPRSGAKGFVGSTLALCLAYAILRYHIAGPVPWNELPLFILNKGLALAGLMLLIFATSIHLMALLGGDQAAMSNVLKDTALAGGAFILSGVLAGEEDAAES